MGSLEETYVIIEFGEKFDVEEEDGSAGQLLRDDIKENLGAIVFIVLVVALLALDCYQTHPNEIRSVTEEDSLSPYYIYAELAIRS